ncbi:hypothetical protein [Phenylobacterium sp. J367]|uniref:hypothetical protein n=1 Tax=Phenylobacterium sp. J367 TaxID=2898435 RepID=UPI002150CFCA|nr:hypothetical protein [Phenylobacterium sp. J367]MCR5878285.1 hypothetical protein [Phenylobacterium sp. J367]
MDQRLQGVQAAVDVTDGIDAPAAGGGRDDGLLAAAEQAVEEQGLRSRQVAAGP